MRQLDADVYVFEEIENKNILIDISNRLSGNSWNQGRNWNYAFFAKLAILWQKPSFLALKIFKMSRIRYF